MAKPIRVLIAEDSAVTREYLAAILGDDADIELVGAARDGAEAVSEVERLRPDVLLMDVHMPRMDGVAATREIMSRCPTPIVLATAGFAPDETTLGFEAIQAGALAVIEKPGGLDDPETLALVRTVKLMSEVKVVRRWPVREIAAPRPRLPRRDSPVRVIAIGASTGGPAALSEVLGNLGGHLSVPVLVVQHMSPGFIGGLAEWLGRQTRLPVKVARDGEPVADRTVHLAPDGAEMGIDHAGRIRLSVPGPSAFCPTADHLFTSVSAAYGRSALGVLLTGMGEDGAKGLRTLRQEGGLTVAQDEATSVVFGMPAAAVRLDAAEHVLPPKEIAELIRSLSEPKKG